MFTITLSMTVGLMYLVFPKLFIPETEMVKTRLQYITINEILTKSKKFIKFSL